MKSWRRRSDIFEAIIPGDQLAFGLRRGILAGAGRRVKEKIKRIGPQMTRSGSAETKKGINHGILGIHGKRKESGENSREK